VTQDVNGERCHRIRRKGEIWSKDEQDGLIDKLEGHIVFD
jgi:hypothetical protein